jgi:hypothetical protein
MILGINVTETSIRALLNSDPQLSIFYLNVKLQNFHIQTVVDNMAFGILEDHKMELVPGTGKRPLNGTNKITDKTCSLHE